MTRATSELFELIAGELARKSECVISAQSMSEELVEDLITEYDQPSGDQAIQGAVDFCSDHFKSKNARLPFNFAFNSMTFSATDPAYLSFVSAASSVRHFGNPQARWFEYAVCKRLELKLSVGEIHNVGSPRTSKAKVEDFRQHLALLGFENSAVSEHTQDAGLDVIWLPPIGTVPVRPIVSLQCKNSRLDFDDASSSVASSRKAFAHHAFLRQCETYLCCVVFNDYIGTQALPRVSGWTFVPLGLTDLAKSATPFQSVYLWEPDD